MKRAALTIFLALILSFSCSLKPESRPDRASLGFKGLHLGMSTEALRALLQANREWRLSYPREEGRLPKRFSGLAYLTYDNLRGIGCEGPLGEETCHPVEVVQIGVAGGKVVRILLGKEFFPDQIHSGLQEWGRFALSSLVQKYGPPSALNLPLSQVEMDSFKGGRFKPLYEWDKGDQAIALGVGEDRLRFVVAIRFEDRRALANEKGNPAFRPEL